jgi:hypothetical protein
MCRSSPLKRVREQIDVLSPGSMIDRSTLLSSPLVGEDEGEGAKERITLSPTLSPQRERGTCVDHLPSKG